MLSICQPTRTHTQEENEIAERERESREVSFADEHETNEMTHIDPSGRRKGPDMDLEGGGDDDRRERLSEHSDALYHLARLHLRRGRARESIQALDSLTLMEPDDSHILAQFAIALYEHEEFERAEKVCM